MFSNCRIKEWWNGKLVRAHACTLALSVGFANAWGAPHEAFLHGALSWGLAHAVTAVVVALPLTLLHLSLGQLSQLDAVGVWKAVPFFKGIGYLRLTISFVAASYNAIYVAAILTYLLRTIFDLEPFWECTETIGGVGPKETVLYNFLQENTSSCINETLTETFTERPEFYLGLALVIIAVWLTFPFILYNPTKMLKRAYYVLGPVVLILCIVIVSCLGERDKLLSMQDMDSWRSLVEPLVWHNAMTHSLWSCQLAGGFLVTAGGTIYSDTNLYWTTLVIVAVNVLGTWCWLLFWLAIGGRGNTDTFTLLVQIDNAVQQQRFSTIWSSLITLALLLAGGITMLALLYPLYERFRRIGGPRWRRLCIISSVGGVCGSLALLAGRDTALHLIEHVTLPALITATTGVELMALVIIYGRQKLMEDISFLTGRSPGKLWVGWYLCALTLVPTGTWWVTVNVAGDHDWGMVTVAYIVTAAVILIVLLVTAAVVVHKQDQYDCLGKLRSSFKPSLNWGPRDPITHYYWLSRREEFLRGDPHPRVHRPPLGQLAGGHINLAVIPVIPHVFSTVPIHTVSLQVKRRNQSDDYIYTVYRKKCIKKSYLQFLDTKFRSKSLE